MDGSARVVQPQTITKRSFLVIALTATAAVLLFIGTSAMTHAVGFPLDDAWIHQTYARSLAQRGEWAFLPGVPSAGSTSPLWTVLLAPGQWNLIPMLVWTFLLGILSLTGLAVLGERLFRNLTGESAKIVPVAGVFLALEWHLVWAAASGMETALFALWIMGVMVLLSAKRKKWFLTGLLVGAAAWVRPDGITLLGPVLFVQMLEGQGIRARINGFLITMVGFALGFLPYLSFNRLISGAWFPNTFYAKQAEYAVYQQIPLLERFASLAVLPLIGAGVLLLPGVIYAVVWALRSREILTGTARQRKCRCAQKTMLPERSEGSLPMRDSRQMLIIAMFLWWAGYSGLYAMRLPVTYQHGRYLMPAMPIFFMLGLAGSAWLYRRLKVTGRLRFVMTRSAVAIAIGLTLAFFVIGARQYAQDVAIIETEMVDTAHWVAAATKPDVFIAAHDIGALGYFGQRRLLDLAGLISPEVIPFIRDEEKLGAYLDDKQVDYLITFPDWYPTLSKRGEIVYQSQATFSIEAGGENMTVFRWQTNDRKNSE
jgi:hypothetical protein